MQTRLLPTTALLRATSLTLLLACVSFAHAQADNDSIKLPDLGDGGYGSISLAQERKLGLAWLRMYRAQVRTSQDPILYDYVEKLLADLVPHSELAYSDLSVIITPNPNINAFAVPGGVVGVNTGLFLYAEHEDQMASVLAHELAHLSQRHYARGVEAAANSAIPNMAGLLAGLILAAATGNSEAGLAAISATQAASLQNQLRFSRQNEQEADRIGLQTMVDAGRDPNAGADMFEAMLRETRYSSRPPEFLLTHPLTESRVADARNRALRLPKDDYVYNEAFYFMQARTRLLHSENANIAVKVFRHELNGDTPSEIASRYGLTLALIESGQFEEAQEQVNYLLEMQPNNTLFTIAAADLEAKLGRFDEALRRLGQALQDAPDDHPLNTTMAEILMESGNYSQAELQLTRHTRRRPSDEYLWYLLAEVRGLSGNILGLHKARAEYFILNGIYDKARIQLDNALKLAKTDYDRELLVQRRIDVDRMAKDSDLRG